MAEIVLFHHVQGLTPGVTAFADTLRQAGHTVHVPHLLDGKRFASIPDGLAYLQHLGFATIIGRGAAAVAELPENLVYVRMSTGVLPAQALAQTRPGARAAVFLHGAVPVAEFSPSWPASVPVQIHAMDADPEFVASGDIEAARQLVAQAENGALFLYPGSGHLFTDATLSDYHADATASVTARVLAFLARI